MKHVVLIVSGKQRLIALLIELTVYEPELVARREGPRLTSICKQVARAMLDWAASGCTVQRSSENVLHP